MPVVDRAVCGFGALVSTTLQYYRPFRLILKSSMAFTFGVLLGVILKRHRQPRLKQLRAELQKKPPSELTLYQYPAKQIFCILAILTFALCLEWFAAELEKDLLQINISSIKTEEQTHFTSINQEQAISENSSKVEMSASADQRLGRLRNTINFIHLLSVVGLATLLSAIRLRVVKTNKRSRTIEATTYNWLMRTDKQAYSLQEGDKIEIWEMGENRFTNTNYYYSIRAISSAGNWEIIRKSNIFSSRTATIQLGFLHNLPYSTKIIKKSSIEPEQEQQ